MTPALTKALHANDIRSEFQAMVVGDLLGPAGGESKELTERNARTLTATMNDYTREELRDTLISVMRKGTTYKRKDVIYAVAHHLGFSRVTDAVHDPIKSAINSGIRQGILGHEGSVIWTER